MELVYVGHTNYTDEIGKTETQFTVSSFCLAEIEGIPYMMGNTEGKETLAWARYS